MSDQSVFDNTSLSSAALTNPYQIALQSLCKQLLKSRLFRGFYLERRYVESIEAYRDVVCLQKSEKSLKKLLHDVRDKLQLFYSYQNPKIWIGITDGTVANSIIPPPFSLETYLWVELNDLAFGQYWFSIKSIRFREKEIILKLKEVQPVEETSNWAFSTTNTKENCNQSEEFLISSPNSIKTIETTLPSMQTEVTFDDFMVLFHQWRVTIKQTLYDFISQDISKENITNFLRFVGLLIVSILSGGIEGAKFLGIFTLRFMFEISRFTHVLTPIILKIIDMFSKIVGGFFILLTMIWKDGVVNRNQPRHYALEYNRPIYKSIQAEVKQGKQRNVEKSFN